MSPFEIISRRRREYPTRFLNENGQQITHEVYTEMLNSIQLVYIACFVGCTYHRG